MVVSPPTETKAAAQFNLLYRNTSVRGAASSMLRYGDIPVTTRATPIYNTLNITMVPLIPKGRVVAGRLTSPEKVVNASNPIKDTKIIPTPSQHLLFNYFSQSEKIPLESKWKKWRPVFRIHIKPTQSHNKNQ